jgi:hypothetical protein
MPQRLRPAAQRDPSPLEPRQRELDGVPTAAQRARLAWAERRMRLANRIDLPLLLLAGLTMAVGRYL